MRAFARRLPALCLALAAACARPSADATASGPTDAATDAALGVPAEPPSLAGVVAAVQEDGRVLLERRPAPADCGGRAIVTLGPDTHIVRRSGEAATAADVTAGQWVSAWFTGPELRSCPVQVLAAVIVLEPTGP